MTPLQQHRWYLQKSIANLKQAIATCEHPGNKQALEELLKELEGML